MGEDAPFFQRAQMYIFQLCEIAQMVEFNANGLAGFWHTLKNVSIAGIKFGREWSVWLFKEFVSLFKRFKTYLRSSFEAYFIRKDLSKEELEQQIWWIKIISRVIIAFVFVNVLRVAVRIFFMRQRKLAKSLAK